MFRMIAIKRSSSLGYLSDHLRACLLVPRPDRERAAVVLERGLNQRELVQREEPREAVCEISILEVVLKIPGLVVRESLTVVWLL
jgi:hypothetical protein